MSSVEKCCVLMSGNAKGLSSNVKLHVALYRKYFAWCE